MLILLWPYCIHILRIQRILCKVSIQMLRELLGSQAGLRYLCFLQCIIYHVLFCKGEKNQLGPARILLPLMWSWTFTFIFHQIFIIAIILFIESLQLFIRWHKYQHNTSNIYPETTHWMERPQHEPHGRSVIDKSIARMY